MSWDIRSERIAARAAADKARAEAEAIRAKTAREARLADEELRSNRQDRRRTRARERRQELAKNVRRHGDLALPTLAVGAPALIAWRGQFEFAAEKMRLGLMAPLLPVAIEGSVLYSAFLTHRAVAEGLPAGRYRALTWTLAGVAAGMNFWHGHAAGSAQVGVALALTSLLSIVLLELTVALRKARTTKQQTGRDAAQIRRALIRRVRYPRLSIATAAIAAARDIPTDQAWHAAWVDRYGLGPEATRSERRIARAVMRRQARAARRSARKGGLTVVDGQVVPTQWFDDSSERPHERAGQLTVDAPVDGEAERSRPLAEEPQEVRETVARVLGQDLVRDVERYLSTRTEQPGGLAELPTDGPHEPSAAERWGSGVDGADERPAPAHDTDTGRIGESCDERPVSAHDDDGERSRKRPGERPRKRSPKGRRSRRGGQGEHAQRLAQVRKLLAEDPEMSGGQIAARTGIPESTARRLAAQVRAEQSGGGEA
ncbi:DUF2637 domain-containing protein [Actinomadura rudentiformis]|uniref:DUF2637 domain-containing protein n=1 Tax=Actinomadura rudentiformis TaxID=359158 RepID=A0A6H9YWH8_9ACTN|nr:DUF2637 domain-containing protein [Actinomadura rudentiformis]KAB2351607.1 DUF2637 domain-containing protein [Actinomadura rudentiformis]